MKNQKVDAVEVLERMNNISEHLKFETQCILFADFCFDNNKYLEIISTWKNNCKRCGECNKEQGV